MKINKLLRAFTSLPGEEYTFISPAKIAKFRTSKIACLLACLVN